MAASVASAGALEGSLAQARVLVDHFAVECDALLSSTRRRLTQQSPPNAVMRSWRWGADCRTRVPRYHIKVATTNSVPAGAAEPKGARAFTRKRKAYHATGIDVQLSPVLRRLHAAVW